MEKTRIIRQIQTYRYMMFSKKTHAYRAHAHTVRVKDLPFHLYHLYLYYGWGVEDVSQMIHAYRVRAVPVIVF